MKFYPGILAATYADRFAALVDYGFTSKRAAEIICEADINQSPVVMVDVGEGGGIALVGNKDGAVDLYLTIVDKMFDTADEALELVQRMEAELVRNISDRAGAEWAVFSVSALPTSARH